MPDVITLFQLATVETSHALPPIPASNQVTEGMCEQSGLSYQLEISTFMSGNYKNKAATRLKHKLLSFQESRVCYTLAVPAYAATFVCCYKFSLISALRDINGSQGKECENSRSHI